MSAEELNFRAIAQPLGPAPASEPSADLWSRIAQAHLARRSRRRRQRLAGTGLLMLLVGVTVFIAAAKLPRVTDTDWQARAQALEIELHTHAVTAGGTDNPVALEAETELVRLDSALQAAYDRGAQKNELVPLWKQRSELLTTLLDARRQKVSVTLI
jgi:hypothetical protein